MSHSDPNRTKMEGQQDHSISRRHGLIQVLDSLDTRALQPWPLEWLEHDEIVQYAEHVVGDALPRDSLRLCRRAARKQRQNSAGRPLPRLARVVL
jgi:hypothetical protein